MGTIPLPVETKPSECNSAQSRPNILWIQADDISVDLGCYGEALVNTPNIDRLAAEGVLFRNAFSTSPICSPARSAAITGMYQPTINAHNHRSFRYKRTNHLPENVRLLPEIFREHGYYNVLAHVDHPAKQRYLPENPKDLGKSDYNFTWDRACYDTGGSPGLRFEAWPGFTSDRPFFAQVQLRGGKFRTEEARAQVDESSIKVHPYYPDRPVFIDRWARYLAAVIHLDTEVGMIMDQLEAGGFAENTAVFFFADHGPDNIRHKQTLYDGGIHVPLIVRPPSSQSMCGARSDLVSQIDIAARSLGFAGIPVPSGMHGADLFAPDFQPREYIVAARDRSGANIDHVRCVRTDRYKYIRNFYPEKPSFSPENYMYRTSHATVLRNLHEAGQLNAAQSRFLDADRPEEEFYDLQIDPHEINNLADDPSCSAKLAELRGVLDRWIERTGDLGALKEPVDEMQENTWYHRPE